MSLTDCICNCPKYSLIEDFGKRVKASVLTILSVERENGIMTNPWQPFREHLLVERGLSPQTVAAYISDLQQWQKHIPNRAIQTITTEECEQFIRAHSELGQTSKQRKLASLRAYFQFLHWDKDTIQDPTENINIGKLPRHLPRTHSIEAINKFLESFDDPSPRGICIRAMMELCYSSGLRVSELLNIRERDILWESRTLRVLGKGSKERILPIGKSALQWLIKYLALEDSRRKDHALLFPNFSRQEFWSLVREAGRSLGMKISPHSLRHSFASHLLSGGMNLRSIQTLLGHADISTTQIYTRVEEQHLIEAFHLYHPRK